MSDYVKEKVLRVPFEKYENSLRKRFSNLVIEPEPADYFWTLELFKQYPNLFSIEPNHFEFSPTETTFIDFILDYEYGADGGEFGKVRDLSKSEKEKYRTKFEEILPDIDMNDVKLIEFCWLCWYNCCEAPDYYNKTNDPFYDEL